MEKTQTTPWEEISKMLSQADSASVIEAYLDALGPTKMLHTVFSLKPENQRALLSALTPHRAASLVEELPDGHAADLIEEMSVTDAAPIVVEMASDHRVDVLSELDSKDADAIIAELDEEDAQEVRELISYEPDQAGGLMMKEFASYPMAKTVREVVDDFRDRAVDRGWDTELDDDRLQNLAERVRQRQPQKLFVVWTEDVDLFHRLARVEPAVVDELDALRFSSGAGGVDERREFVGRDAIDHFVDLVLSEPLLPFGF